MLVFDRVQTNAYRILRLSARATWSEIQSAEAAITRDARLGRAGVGAEASARAAVGTLRSPRQRIEQRLFWFHGPASLEHTLKQELLTPTEIAHDNFLRDLEAAYSAEAGDTTGILAALRQWHEFILRSHYWEVSLKLERDGAFEPAAITSEFESLQAHAVEFAADDLAKAAVDARDRGDFQVLHRYVAGFRGLEETGPWAELRRNRLLDPMTSRLADARKTLKDQYRTQIVYQDNAAEHNEDVCLGELQYYRDFIEPAWKNIVTAFTENDAEVRVARGQTADCLSDIVVDHTWAGKFLLAEELATEAVTLASGTIVEERIRKTLLPLLNSAQARKDNVGSALRSALEAFHARFAGQVVRGENAMGRNPMILAEELKCYRDSIEPALNKLLGKLSDDKEAIIWRERAAACLSGIATDFCGASDYIIAEGLANEALALAHGTETAAHIQKGLAKLKEAANLQRRRRSADLLTHSARELVHLRCREIAATFAGRIVAKQGFAPQNRLVCSDELTYFRTQIEPPLNQVVQLSQPEDRSLAELREEVARCLSNIALHHTWAEEFIIAERLMQESLRLASGTRAATELQETYLRICQGARNQRLYESLEAISSAPSLSTVNTIGFKLYGRSDYDKDTDSFATTHYFVILSLPVFPVGRYRVIQDRKNSGSYRFLGKLPLRKREYWHLGVAIALAAIVIITALFNSNTAGTPSASYTPSTSAVSQDASYAGNTDDSRPQPINASRNSGHQTTSIKGRVDEIGARLDSLDAQIRSRKSDAEDLQRQMKPLHDEIELLKKGESSGIPIDTQWYDSKVDDYNNLVRRHRSVVSEVNVKVHLHNQLLAEQNSLVDEYKRNGGNVQ
jgi:hypothetical protein